MKKSPLLPPYSECYLLNFRVKNPCRLLLFGIKCQFVIKLGENHRDIIRTLTMLWRQHAHERFLPLPSSPSSSGDGEGGASNPLLTTSQIELLHHMLMRIYIYIYIYLYLSIYIYIYIYTYL